MPKKVTKTERTRLLALKANGDANPLNQNSRKHGIYVNHFQNDEEQQHYEKFVSNLIHDLDLKLPMDIEQAEVAGVYHLQIYRAFASNDFDAQDKAARASRVHLVTLRATRETRVENQASGQSICEIVSGLITSAKAKGLLDN